jgi:LysM repeat protein
MLRFLWFGNGGWRTTLLLATALSLILIALPSAAVAAPATNGPYIHVVQKGQTLSGIARFYGVTVSALARYNGLQIDSWVYVGQKLRIPPAGAGHKPYPGHPPVGCVKYHVVQKGDTLSYIAKWYHINLYALAQLNNISNANHIYVGQKICIPSAYKGVN